MISVVIPAFNESEIIGKTLDSLVKQQTQHPFEVIVVDNNSTDDTVVKVKAYTKDLDLTIIQEKVKGRSPARRAGFAHAKGDIILSTDADTILPKNWVEEMVSYFSDTAIGAVTGRCKINDSGWFTDTFFNNFQPLSMVVYRILFGHYWLSGFNFGIRKSLYEQAGGFNPHLNSQEDTELSFRVHAVTKIQYVSEPYVYFSGRRFQQGVIKGLFEYASSWIAVIVLKRNKTILSDVR